MKRGVASILLIAILALIPCLPTLAEGNSTGAINITMTPVETLIAIELSPTEWVMGNVTANTTYKTDPEATWCSINNTGTVKVDLGIKGEDACNSTYRWVLSNDGTNDGLGSQPEYALWYHIASDSAGNYTVINTTDKPMEKGGENITLEVSKGKQFGLRLLTPVSLPSEYIGKEMETTITISAVRP